MKKRKRKRSRVAGPVPFETTLRPRAMFFGIAFIIGALFFGALVVSGRDMKLDCERHAEGLVRCAAYTRNVLGAATWTVDMPRGSVVDRRCTTGKGSSCRLVAIVPGEGERELSRSTGGTSDTWNVKARLDEMLKGGGEPTMHAAWGWSATVPRTPLIALGLLLLGLALVQWRTEVRAGGEPMVLTIRTVRFPLSTTKTYPLVPGTKFERSEAGFLELVPPGGTPERLWPFWKTDPLVEQLAKDLRAATPKS